MLKKMITTTFITAIILVLVGCSTTMPAENTLSHVLDEFVMDGENNDSENELVITEENVDAIKAEHEFKVTYKLIKEEPTTKQTPNTYVIIDDDGTERFVIREFACWDNDGNEYEFFQNYQEISVVDYFAVVKDKDGNIFVQTHDNGMNVDTNEGEMTVLEKDIYDKIYIFEKKKEQASDKSWQETLESIPQELEVGVLELKDAWNKIIKNFKK